MFTLRLSLALCVLCLAAPGAALASNGSAPDGCAFVGSVFTRTESCVSTVTGAGPGPDQWSFKNLKGTARSTTTNDFGCFHSETVATGTPTYFSVRPDHSADAVFRMTGTTTQTASTSTDPETGEIICGPGTTTTPIEPYELTVAWRPVDGDPALAQICFSNAGCGDQVPAAAVKRNGK
jgi:hypothetical protein